MQDGKVIEHYKYVYFSIFFELNNPFLPLIFAIHCLPLRLIMQVKVNIINKSPHELPSCQTEGSSGMDIRAWLPQSVTLAPLARRLIPTGLYMALPAGYEAQLRPRSGIAIKKGLTLINTPGSIDSDYRGEIMVAMVNLSGEEQTITDGERIAQMIISKYENVKWECVEELEETARGEGGFGHTGHV